MKQSNKQKKIQILTAIFSIFTLGQTLALTPKVSAETVKRVNARCKLVSDEAKVYDGHCTFKHKQRDGVDVFAIDLDNGQNFSFRGRSLDALQIEDYSGVHNVGFKSQDGGDKDVFRWQNTDGDNKLVVKLDNETPANANTSMSSEEAVGTLIGVGIGALITNLIGGNNNTSNQPKPSQPTASQLPENPYKVGDYYNASSYFKCSVGKADHKKQCPGGIVRRGNGNATVVVKYPNGYEVQYDFKNGNVTSTFGGKLDWGKDGDEWYIGIDDGSDKLFIIIPDAAVNGG